MLLVDLRLQLEEEKEKFQKAEAVIRQLRGKIRETASTIHSPNVSKSSHMGATEISEEQLMYKTRQIEKFEQECHQLREKMKEMEHKHRE